MATRKVTIVHPNSGQKTVIEAPANIPMERLVPVLASRLGLPTTDQRGQPIQYRLSGQRGEQERQLNAEETFDTSGVQDDDVLRLSADMRAGAEPR